MALDKIAAVAHRVVGVDGARAINHHDAQRDQNHGRPEKQVPFIAIFTVRPFAASVEPDTVMPVEV
jgi:hypothetical protein